MLENTAFDDHDKTIGESRTKFTRVDETDNKNVIYTEQVAAWFRKM